MNKNEKIIIISSEKDIEDLIEKAKETLDERMVLFQSEVLEKDWI